MSDLRNHYDVLNVAQNAEPVVVEAAYRALMKKYHPDHIEGAAHAASKAAEINQAFAVLKDPAQRAAYDHVEWKRQQAIRAFAAMPPRRPGVFGWTGWALAATLGFIMTIVSVAPSDVVPPAGKESKIEIAATVEPGSGSQPPHTDSWVAVTEGSDQIRAEALAAATAVTAATAAVGTANAMPSAPMPAVQLRSYAPKKVTATPPKKRPSAKPRAASSPRQTDFLEREGYIY